MRHGSLTTNSTCWTECRSFPRRTRNTPTARIIRTGAFTTISSAGTEFTAVICQVDDMMYSELPRAEFIYTQQIGRGGDMCDYYFKKR